MDKNHENKFDVILGLGVGISQEGDLPESGRAIVKKAVELFKTGVAKKIIFSGKWSYRFEYQPKLTEAAAMKNLAISLGVAEDKILTEENSDSTVTNLVFVKKDILKPLNLKSVILVVAKPHAQRAEYNLKMVLGPSYKHKVVVSNYDHPPEYLAEFLERERFKMIETKLRYKNVVPGDHEKILKIALEFQKGQDKT